ncbi:MAG TPA: hypothetical protein VHO70_17265 [Chitinispirillaceae bacterium]|nr:hypothetical protein [Chitinispirillaceae bacterium]
MRHLALILIFVLGISFDACDKNDTNQNFLFEAKVLGRNNDCGLYAIQITKNIQNANVITGTNSYDIFIAKNLPSDLQIEGLSISLNIRKIQDSELGICTAMGPSYPWIYVLEAEENKK